jgi:hypothetical protein
VQVREGEGEGARERNLALCRGGGGGIVAPFEGPLLFGSFHFSSTASENYPTTRDRAECVRCVCALRMRARIAIADWRVPFSPLLASVPPSRPPPSLSLSLFVGSLFFPFVDRVAIPRFALRVYAPTFLLIFRPPVSFACMFRIMKRTRVDAGIGARS